MIPKIPKVDIDLNKITLTKKFNVLRISPKNIEYILKILKKYDYENRPRKVIINGKIIYKYKKLQDEPEKSIRELESLIRNPEKTYKYENFIKRSLIYLLNNEVKVIIKDIKMDLSGQWDYKNLSL